ncbi:MAG: hypothetical protein LBR77_07250 [Lachnospiraceae bacterium]|jgi:hypothetical protein|nr:hypothetical protein [Lachnospiraceae bacterium]
MRKIRPGLRRLVSGALALALAAHVFGAFPLVSLGAPTSRIEGVDYTRIKENEQLKLPVTIGFGEVNFDRAELVNGKTLTPEEVDEEIRRVMNAFTFVDFDGVSQVMTSGRLNYMKDVYRRAASVKGDYVKGFDAAAMARLMGMLLGFDPAKGWSELGVFAAGKLNDIILGFLGGPIGLANALASLGLSISTQVIDSAGELFRMYEQNLVCREALFYYLLEEQFYQRCNDAIADRERREGSDDWKIKCNQMVWKNSTVFDVASQQYWQLTCDLTKDFDYGGGDPMDWSGRYTGTMKLDIWNDCSTFDETFLDNVFLSKKLAFYALTSAMLFKDQTDTPTKLTKSLTDGQFEIHLDRSNGIGGELTWYFDLKGFRDESQFLMSHKVVGTIKNSVFDEQGIFRFSTSNAYGEADAAWQFLFNGVVESGNKSIGIMEYEYDTKVGAWAVTPAGFQVGRGDGGEDVSWSIMRDHDVWKDLKNGSSIEIKYDTDVNAAKKKE